MIFRLNMVVAWLAFAAFVAAIARGDIAWAIWYLLLACVNAHISTLGRTPSSLKEPT